MVNHRFGALVGAPLLASLLALTAFSGCVAAEEEGRVTFFVKDAPIDELSSLFVTFSKVEIHRVGGHASPSQDDDSKDENETEDDDGNETEDDDANETESDSSSRRRGHDRFESRGEDHDSPDDGEGSWVTIVNESLTIDLKKFTGNDSALLGGLDVAPGTYNKVRLYVDSAYGIRNGTEVNVTVPSGVLKIKYRWTVVAGEATVFTVDFDLTRSLVKLPDGTYILKPHLKIDVDRKDRDEDRKDAEHRLRKSERDEWKERGRDAEKKRGAGHDGPGGSD